MQSDIDALLQRGANPTATPGYFAEMVLGNALCMQLANHILKVCTAPNIRMSLIHDPANQHLLAQLAKRPNVNLDLFQSMVACGFHYQAKDFTSQEVPDRRVTDIIMLDQARRLEAPEPEQKKQRPHLRLTLLGKPPLAPNKASGGSGPKP